MIRYRAKGALREVEKALGLPEDVTSALSSQLWGWSKDGIDEDRAAEFNLRFCQSSRQPGHRSGAGPPLFMRPS